MVLQAPKMSARVVNAIRNLREAHGSTSKEIMNYIKSECGVPESAVQRQMHAALKRGLDYGILMKSNGHYFLNTEAEVNLSSAGPPMERRSRRRRSSRRRKVRRRSRGKRRRRSRRRRRRPRSRRPRRRMARTRRMGRGMCRCNKRNEEVRVLSAGIGEPRIGEDDACSCGKNSNGWPRNAQDEPRRRSVSRRRSSTNSNARIEDRRSVHDQD